MFENKIMYEIIEKIQSVFPVPISICDVSGRVMVSTDSSSIGDLNLLAIKALDINANVFASSDRPFQKSGAAMPLMLQGHRMGAVVVEQSGSPDSHAAELLAKTVELLYQEIFLSKKQQNQSQERDQFLYKWLHFQTDYTNQFIKEGEMLGIDIAGIQSVLLKDQEQTDPFSSPSILQNLLGDHDILLPLSHTQTLVILKESENYDKKYRRILSACTGSHMGICRLEPHLYTAYQAATESLSLGKLLFPEQQVHDYEHMKLAIALSHLDFPGLEDPFARLAEKGRTAQLAETAAAYIYLNGDIRSVCEKLHIHRNSIPYRLRRIEELCGKNLTNSYDLMYLYASMIRYMKLYGDFGEISTD